MGESLQPGAVRAGVYGRESQGQLRSIEGQLADGEDEARELGWTVVGTYLDHVSASRHAKRARDDWPRILTDVDSGKINAVVVRDSSRADRRPAEWLQFLDLCRDRGALIRAVTESYTYDVRRWRDYDALAREGLRNAGESERTRDRALLGQATGHRNGSPHGGDTPYGYRRVRRVETTDHGHRTVVEQVPDPDTSPTVVKIFEDIRAGVPIRALVEDLNRHGVTPPGRGSQRWYASRVKGIISNPAYRSVRKRKGHEDREGNWPALVTDEAWFGANRVLANNRLGYRPGAVEHLLSGVMVCDRCEFKAGIHNGKYGRRYLCKGPRACSAVIADEADELVTQELFEHLLSPHVRHRIKQQATSSDEAYLAARGEVERLGRELEQQLIEYAREGASARYVALYEAEQGRKIQDAERRAEAASMPPATRHFLMGPDSWDPVTGQTEPGAQIDITDEVTLGERWEAMTVPARRELLREQLWVRLLPGRKGVRQPVRERITYGFH